MVKTSRLPATHVHGVQRLDPARIGGISSAIALHIIAFGLLMMPAQVPMPSPPEIRTRFEPVFRDPPPPPPPPIKVDVVERPSIIPKPSTPTPPRRELAQTPSDALVSNDLPSLDPPVVVDHGDTVVPSGGGETVVPGNGGPVTGIALQYLSNPKPVYPREALRNGQQGTVMLRVVVDEAGNPIEVSIATSSGHRVLDRAAREQVLRKWKFVPARHNGRTVKAEGTVPVAFTING